MFEEELLKSGWLSTMRRRHFFGEQTKREKEYGLKTWNLNTKQEDRNVKMQSNSKTCFSVQKNLHVVVDET